MDHVDVAVIGAGIAGASAAWAISRTRRVCLLEREPQPSTQASGRSVTMFAIAYGDSVTRALSLASRPFFLKPPEGFTDAPLLSPRAMLHVASPGQERSLAALAEAARLAGPELQLLDASAVSREIPILLPDKVTGGILDRAAASIDDHRYMQACLRGVKANGGSLHCNVDISAIEPAGCGFRIRTSHGTFTADHLVNAAGAWGDEVAALAGIRPLGLRALRRTAITIDAPDGQDPSAWPMAIDVDEQWYFKPEAGRLVVSPADETEVPPHDVQPEEWDVAVAIDRYEQLTGASVQRIHHRWAGLRTFAPDHSPVVGRSPEHERFIWLAGQGGAGFMTAPAMAEVAAALVDGRKLPEGLEALMPALSPARPGLAAARA